ncbi:hypothetical protein cypCar_00009333 [Cyprinus carpio]|nr:hypothetical protein cypCar_00009333 [Cyprinus carpio]
MGPQLHFSSTYSEEFSYPARVKPTRPRPSSAYRRNNPHPQPEIFRNRSYQISLEPADGDHAIFKSLQTPGYPSSKIALKIHY